MRELELEIENKRLIELLKRLKLECEAVQPDETDLYNNLTDWDIYGYITEGLSHPTPSTSGILKLAKAGYECAETFYKVADSVGAPINEEYQHTCLAEFRADALSKATQSLTQEEINLLEGVEL